MMRLFPSILVLLLAVPAGAAAQDTPTACPVDRSPAGAWRLVRGDHFTFCVPATWRPQGPAAEGQDARRWHGRGGTVSWSREPLVQETRRTTVVMVSGADLAEAQRTGGRWPSAVEPAPPRQLSEMIGGRPVILVIGGTGADQFTEARTTFPALYFAGTARSSRTAELELEIYRTLRVETEP
jgi:hypothetical protein